MYQPSTIILIIPVIFRLTLTTFCYIYNVINFAVITKYIYQQVVTESSIYFTYIVYKITELHILITNTSFHCL